jgi:hypothetical protein
MTNLLRAFATFAAVVCLSGCVVYEPVPAADPFGTSWRAAMGAIGDTGLTLVSADQATGTIRGARGSLEGIIAVQYRPDGRIGVEISSRDPDKLDPTLTRRLTDAYNRRMGR